MRNETIFSRFLSLSFLLALASSVSGQVVIVNALSGKVLDLRGSSSTDGTAIQQWDWTGGGNQQWQLTPLGNGYNRISSVATGKVLDVTGVSTADGALIQEWDWTGAGNQQWQIIPLGSSYNEIVNLNSGKVLDDSGYSLVNGTQMQQWDWLNGLNQQWSVVPVQNAYQTTGQTNLYYNASTGKITATATLDYDYHSQYYYNTQGGVEIFDNQSGVGGNTWGYLSLSSGNVSVVATVPAYAGHTYEARSGYSLVTAYTYAQVVSGCGSLCSDWYDAYNYYAILENPQGTQDIPTFSTTVWATPIVVAVAIAEKTIALGNNGSSYRVPGPTGIFDLKFRAFIPPAWVRGPDPCYANGNITTTIYGGDNRGFDPYSPSYRAHSEAQVSTQTGTWSGSLGPEFAANPYFDAGTTTRFASDALDANGYTLHTDSVYHDCHYTDDKFKEDPSQMHASASGGNGAVTVNFYGTVNDQTSDLGTLTPGLGYNVRYSINTANSYVPAYTFEYSHKCYPAYEAYVGSQQVYGYKPTHNDPATVIVCLAGGLSVTGSTIGTVN